MGLRDQKRAKNRTPEVKFFEYIKQRKPRTQKIYTEQMKELCAHWGTSINEIAEIHENYVTNDNKDGTLRAFQQFVNYATTGTEDDEKGFIQREPTLSKFSAEQYLKPLNVLFGVSGLAKVPFKFSSAHPKAAKKINQAQIRELLEGLTDPRMRALIMTLKDTGLRVGDVSNLTVDDYLRAQVHKDEYGGYYKMWATSIITEKNEVEAQVIIGPEAVAALESYIGNRISGPIFLMKHKDAGQKKMTGPDITIRIGYRCKHLKSRGFQLSAHSFRKFYYSNMLGNGVPESLVKRLCGKKIPPSIDAYIDWEGQEIEFYMQAYNRALALNETAIVVEKMQEKQQASDYKMIQMQAQIDALTSTLKQMMQANFTTPGDQPTDPKHLEMIKKLKEP